MVMYDEILIPTDGSRGAERGIEHGLDIAQQYDADVHSLYVVEETVYGETPALSTDELYFEKVEESGREDVQEVVQRARERGLDAEGHVTRGTPSKEIADYAREVDVDLVVMGVHGEREGDHPHVGHVSDRVLRSLDTPVFPV